MENKKARAQLYCCKIILLMLSNSKLFVITVKVLNKSNDWRVKGILRSESLFSRVIVLVRGLCYYSFHARPEKTKSFCKVRLTHHEPLSHEPLTKNIYISLCSRISIFLPSNSKLHGINEIKLNEKVTDCMAKMSLTTFEKLVEIREGSGLKFGRARSRWTVVSKDADLASKIILWTRVINSWV